MTEAGDQTTAQRRTWRKAAHKPKHPLNAYNVFFQFERERILNHQSDAPIRLEDVAKIHISQEKKKRRKTKKQQGANGVKVGFADLARTIASKWKQLDDESKAAFEKHAEQEKIRYKLELEQWAQNKAKGDEQVEAAAPQLDDGSILSFGTPLPLQMEEQTMVHPVSPLMFGAKQQQPEMEIPRTIVFPDKQRKQTSEDLPQVTAHSLPPQEHTIARLSNGMVTPPQDSNSLVEGTSEEQEMRQLLEHHQREMSLISSKLNQMENNRVSFPSMPHNNVGSCCAACMQSKNTSNGNTFQNPNMYPQMGNMNMGMNMSHAASMPSLQVMNNSGMMQNPSTFNSFGANPAASGFAPWDPSAVAMQGMGMPSGNGFDFPAICFPANNGPVNNLNFALANSGAWDSDEHRRNSM